MGELIPKFSRNERIGITVGLISTDDNSIATGTREFVFGIATCLENLATTIILLLAEVLLICANDRYISPITILH